MGGSNSVDLDCQRVTEIALELNGQFSKEFNVAYKKTIVQKARKDLFSGSSKDNIGLGLKRSHFEDLSLDLAPIPTQNIKVGYLTKIGANVKSWKRRYFVAKNQSENFVIHYYENDSDMKEKGKFNCCGYKVELFNAEELNSFGSFGIKLKPVDEMKRMWLIRAESEDEQNQWIEVFMNACKRSQPEPQSDEVYSEAFRCAYRVTRASYGYFGVFSIIGTESEMLEQLTYAVLNREILDDHIAVTSTNQTSPVKKKNVSTQVRSTVHKIVKPIVKSTWTAALDTALSMQKSFETSVLSNLTAINANETQLRSHLQEKINELVDPYVVDLEHKVCMPILQSCFKDIIEAYEQALFGFNREMRKTMDFLVKSPSITTMSAEFRRFEIVLEQSSAGAGPLQVSQKILWKLHSIDMVEMCGCSLDNDSISGDDLYLNALNDLKSLMLNAAHTFAKMFIENMIKDGGGDVLNGEYDDPQHGSKGDIQSDMEEIDRNNSTTGSNHHSTTIKSLRNDSAATEEEGNSEATVENDLHLIFQMNRKQKYVTTCLDILRTVISKLTADCKVVLHASFVKLLTDALESTVQEVIVAPSYEVVLSAQKLVKKQTKEFISLTYLGETMVREAVMEFIIEYTQDLAAESSSRLNIVAVQLLSD
mmetsp:Transcript_19565/g.27947  ORF Transcript_19565/g.27947 Transcript_19565/m.27947 type:complete len:649 (-) Transcript_19565:435-2381(-)